MHLYSKIIFFTVKGFEMGAPSPGVKWPQSEADHSSQSNAKVDNARGYASTPPYVFTACCFIEHRARFTFYISGDIQVTISIGFNKPILSPKGRIVV
jgi:hypothetical protein